MSATSTPQSYCSPMRMARSRQSKTVDRHRTAMTSASRCSAHSAWPAPPTSSRPARRSRLPTGCASHPYPVEPRAERQVYIVLEEQAVDRSGVEDVPNDQVSEVVVQA